MNSTKPTTLRPLKVWFNAATVATGVSIIVYTASLALGSPLMPTLVFLFAMVPSFALGCVLPYVTPIRRRLEARQRERDKRDEQLVLQVFAQLPSASTTTTRNCPP
ncbi:hypothetical protein [Enhygromyxa salina]|uniref:Uncharacterized protein n=1 Tax=Enhygromyxa salina TaxID=215803 RepID=A0A2S9YR44_9BACT|nr:hypothetical protein [Enhygromyxa salina]PRQ07567.1 hypothetical protein ENSA7_25570 [Enhygromyxa salina]